MDSNDSNIALRVELPSFAHQFSLSVARTATVLDIKQAIARECIGQPRIEGQRLIWRGRFLKDEETVDEIWKLSTDPKILHLAVNPAFWTTPPPEYPSSTPPESTTPAQRATSLRSTSTASGTGTPVLFPDSSSGSSSASAIPPFRHIPSRNASSGATQRWLSQPNIYYMHLEYIHHQHRKALNILLNRPEASDPDAQSLVSWRESSKRAVLAQGYDWPAQLDEQIPSGPADATGVRYEVTSIEGQDFLKLVDPNAQPTPAQVVALKILTYTFPLLYTPLPPMSSDYATSTHSLHVPVPLNTLLQNAGLGNLRVRDAAQPGVRLHGHPHANPFPQIAIRPLVAPLIMLAIRTALLLYFVSPFNKPAFGLVVVIWIIYETMGVIRGAIVGPRNERRDPQAPAAAPAPGPAPGVPADGNAQQNNGPVVAPPGAAAAVQRRPNLESGSQRQVNALFDSFSNINLRAEEQALDAPVNMPPAPPPTFVHKLQTFVSLFVLSIHPAIWNRRRIELMQREGRVRMQMNNIERPRGEVGEDEQAQQEEARREEARQQLVLQHERRPVWVREYMERARDGEWADDL